jgi:hypothetical protein
MLVTVVITPRPNSTKAVRFDGDVAKFVDRPYRGHAVAWSRRRKVDVKKLKDTRGKNVFEVSPEIWNNTFYGWVPIEEVKQ